MVTKLRVATALLCLNSLKLSFLAVTAIKIDFQHFTSTLLGFTFLCVVFIVCNVFFIVCVALCAVFCLSVVCHFV
jgi:hypothetical protein